LASLRCDVLAAGAAIALWYVSTRNYQAFKDYVTKFEGDLTPEQRSHLAEMGIDPDREPD